MKILEDQTWLICEVAINREVVNNYELRITNLLITNY